MANLIVKLFCLAVATGWVLPTLLPAQTSVPYFSVVEDFDTGETFMDENPPLGMLFLENEQMLVYGGFRNLDYAPWQEWISGFGKINADGSRDYNYEIGLGGGITQMNIHDYDSSMVTTSMVGFTKIKLSTGEDYHEYNNESNWSEILENNGPNNIYDFSSFHASYIQEDQKVILVGNVTLDTIPPKENTALTRLHPDGSIDWDFPRFTLGPSAFNSFISVTNLIDLDSSGFFIEGTFESVNGHYSPYIVKLHNDFTVDTNFTSPFFYIYGLNPQIAYVNQFHCPYVSGARLIYQEEIQSLLNSSDTMNLVRLQPNGAPDTLFQPAILSSENYPSNWDSPENAVCCNSLKVLPISVEKFIAVGNFSSFNGVTAANICVFDSEGALHNEYFQGQGVDYYFYHPPLHSNHPGYEWPWLSNVIPAGNDEFFVLGRFSSFMGYERHNVVKIKLNTVSTSEAISSEPTWQLYPNPVHEQFTVRLPVGGMRRLTLRDMQGRTVLARRFNTDNVEITTGSLAAGIYLCEITTANGKSLGVRKVVKR